MSKRRSHIKRAKVLRCRPGSHRGSGFSDRSQWQDDYRNPQSVSASKFRRLRGIAQAMRGYYQD